MLKIWFCQRHEEYWSGGCVIAAETEADAKKLYMEFDYGQDEPFSIREIPLQRGVLYNDELR